MEDQQPQTFNRGDKVEHEADYVCVPCGFKRHYKPGEEFSECTSCFGGTEEGHEDYADGLELWEKAVPIDDSPPPPPTINLDEEIQ